MMKSCKSVFFLVWLLFSPLLAFAGDVAVQAEISRYQAYADQPIKVLITITHKPSEAVDAHSFTLNGKPISVQFVENVLMTASGDLELSVFDYTMPAQPVGLQLLPAITVKVGGKPYSSYPSTYEVKRESPDHTSLSHPSAPPQPSASNVPQKSSNPSERSEGAFLKLEAIVDGPSTLYPGQQTILEYKYLFNVNVATTKEVIPMVEAKGLIKIGSLITKTKQEGRLSVLQVMQKVQADVPGTYTYGPSMLAGYAYEVKPDGQKVYHKPELSSTAPAVTIKVLPFPAKGKPASFNGAVGDKFSFEVKLLSSTVMSVGDEMTLLVEISGNQNLGSVKLPELCCQPGMSGVFQLSDLPPVGKVEGTTKRFDVHMRPLTDLIKQVPSLEFSYFNPKSEKYVVLKSAPIPITVKPLAVAPPSKSSGKEKPEHHAPSAGWEHTLKQTAPIEIAGIYTLNRADLYDEIFGTWWALLVIPFGAGCMIFQFNLKNYLVKAKQAVKQKASADYFKEAAEAPAGSAMRYSLIKKAFLCKLFERGDLASPEIDIYQLPADGLAGAVRALLTEIEGQRYTGLPYDDQHLLEKSKELFHKLNSTDGKS